METLMEKKNSFDMILNEDKKEESSKKNCAYCCHHFGFLKVNNIEKS